MKNQLAFAMFAATVLCARGAYSADKEVLNRSFDAAPGGTLHMKVDRGSIHITPSAGKTVEVTVTKQLKRGSEAKAREVYDEYKINFSQDGNNIRIEADNPSRWKNMFNQLQVEYRIAIPRRFDLDLHTAGGNIEVTELEGEIKAHTSGGNLRFGSITGPIDAQTSGGNITATAVKGSTRLRTSGGNLNIGSVEGDVTAKTSGGSISLDQVKGATEAETSGGDIHVRNALGAVSAHTSGGNVRAHLGEQPKAQCALKTSGGNVEVTLAENVAVNLNAQTSGGKVNSDFPGEFNKQRTKLIAQVNGGGPGLLLETSGGNVDVRKK